MKEFSVSFRDVLRHDVPHGQVNVPLRALRAEGAQLVALDDRSRP